MILFEINCRNVYLYSLIANKGVLKGLTQTGTSRLRQDEEFRIKCLFNTFELTLDIKET